VSGQGQGAGRRRRNAAISSALIFALFMHRCNI
jgi:hypothetical protein